MGYGKGTGRGGHRPNTPTPSWNHGKTTTMRVPIALKDKLMEIAREMDEKGSSEALSQNPPSLSRIQATLTRYRNLLDEKPSKGNAKSRKDTARWENVEALVSELERILEEED